MKSIAFKPTMPAVITKLTTAALLLLALAACSDGSGDVSDYVSGGSTKKASPQLPAPHPSAAASIISPAAVDLSWDATNDVNEYKIYYAKDSLDGLNGGYKNYAAVGGKLDTTKDTSVTIGDLSADTTYYFVVVADYTGDEAAAPEITADSSYIAELTMGGSHGCVRLNTGGIKCWGYNGNGQLGIGDKINRKTATSVSSILAKRLSAGNSHSCAIDLSDDLYCWGSNEFAQLGLSDDNLSRFIPTPVTQANLASLSLVSAGYTSACALADGKNYCWGSQNRGGLGNGFSSRLIMDAQKIRNINRDVQQFALGKYSGCAIDASGDLWCWGYNGNGQVGDGTTADKTSPVKPKLQGGDDNRATMLDGKNSHYCAIDDAKKTQCWGYNNSGQLGIDSTADSNSPQYVLVSKSNHLEGVSKVATGSFHSCAIITGGSVRCWGDSAYGVIGTDVTADRLIADTDTPNINNAIDIAAGTEATCVLLADKARVKCWGANYYGQLGDGTSYSSHTPVAVEGL